MTDQMPDFDKMTPEEIQKWMEALAVRQGATEGIINDVSDVEVVEIDPNSVDIKDEYIPFGMDPAVWAEKKAKEDAEKKRRIAEMERDGRGPKSVKASAQPAAPTPLEPVADPNPLDFMADLSGSGAPDDLLGDLFGTPDDAPVAAPADDNGFDFLADLGKAAGSASGLDGLGDLDFSGLDALADDAPAAANSLDWLSGIVGGNDAPAAPDLDLFEDEPAASLSETAVGRILDDPMDWLSEAANAAPASPAASPSITPSASDLDALFGMDTPDAPEEVLPSTEDIRAALKTGNADPNDMRVWLDSMLDRGLSRTDVTDDLPDEDIPVRGQVPDWLIAQVGTPPDLSAAPPAAQPPEVVDESDLPDWLTTPVSEDQTAEMAALFNEEPANTAPPAYPSTLDTSASLSLIDTGAIQVEMNDPWVEAFELERSEKMGDTDQLAEWYDEARATLSAPTDSVEVSERPVVQAATPDILQAASLSPDGKLPKGEPQPIPTWMGGEPVAEPAPTSTEELPPWLQSESVGVPAVAASTEDDLPPWLVTDTVEDASADDLPPWLTGEQEAAPAAPAVVQHQTAVPAPRPNPRPQSRGASIDISASEASDLLNAARGSAKMGDIGAAIERYESLIRAQAALDDVTTDLAQLSRDSAHKGNPAVLRVYGDALMRQGKLQAALDTYRAALNLL
jgi:tetratricopeptide (TPR) repeat protein